MRLAAVLLLTVLLQAAPEQSQPTGKRTRKAEAAQSRQSAITGCLDQRGETYVLRSADDMARVTPLKGKAFSDDNFARYIGQQVRVQGNTSNGTFEVTKIDKVAEACSQ